MKSRMIAAVAAVLWVAGGLATHAQADVDGPISDHLSSQFDQADAIANLVTENASSLGDSTDGTDVEFTQFFVGLAPSATFGINSVLDLQVAPEITLTFERTELDN